MTPAPPADPMTAARRSLADLIDHITLARRRLNEGHMIGLTALEDLTRHACQTVAALPREERAELRDLLEAVLHDLDTLSADLTDRFGALARRTDPDGARPRPPTVGDAYRRDEALDAAPPSISEDI